MQESGKFIPFSELKKLRSQFAPGFTGSHAFKMIAREEVCNANDNGSPCKAFSKETVDYDAHYGELEQIPVCGEAHAMYVRKQVDLDLAKRGVIASFSKNGFGREREKCLHPQSSPNLLFKIAREFKYQPK